VLYLGRRSEAGQPQFGKEGIHATRPRKIGHRIDSRCPQKISNSL
jgi:hypothetical protein